MLSLSVQSNSQESGLTWRKEDILRETSYEMPGIKSKNARHDENPICGCQGYHHPSKDRVADLLDSLHCAQNRTNEHTLGIQLRAAKDHSLCRQNGEEIYRDLVLPRRPADEFGSAQTELLLTLEVCFPCQR